MAAATAPAAALNVDDIVAKFATDSKLSATAFSEFVQSLGNGVSSEQASNLFALASSRSDAPGAPLSSAAFAAFLKSLSGSDAGYRVLFELIDVNADERITVADIATFFKTKVNGAPLDFGTEYIKTFFGNNAQRDVSFAELIQFVQAVPLERLRQQFRAFDTSNTGFVTFEQFVQLLRPLRATLPDAAFENVANLSEIASNNKVSFAVASAVFRLSQRFDDVKAAFITSNSHAQFNRTKSSLTPLEWDALLSLAGVKSLVDHADISKLSRVLGIKPKPVVVEKDPKEKYGHLNAVQEAYLHAYHFVLGSIAGMVGATFVFPIDFVKTRMQNQRKKVVGEMLYANSWDCLKKTIRNEGVLGLYSGLIPQLVGVAPEKAIKLTMNDLVRGKLTDPNTGEITLAGEILAGSVAGASQVLFTNPLEIVKVRLQVQGEMIRTAAPGESIVKKSAIAIIRELGFVGLYKGASACFARDIPFSAIYFPAYAHLKKDFFQEGAIITLPDGTQKKKTLSSVELLLAAGIAGMPAAYFCTPQDVIKTRLQVVARRGDTTYSGLWDCAKKIYKEEGFKAFWKGGPARVLRSSPQFGVTLFTYEVLKEKFPAFWLMKKETTTLEDGGAHVGGGVSPYTLLSSNTRQVLQVLQSVDYKFGAVSK